MKILKRISLFALSGIMALSLGACSSKNAEEEQKKFDSFMEKQFVETMQKDYISMHTLIEHPEKYGINTSKVKVSLGERADIESQHKAAKAAAKTWEEFNKFDRDSLTDEQKVTYDSFKFQETLNQELNNKKFDYYQQLFASISGIHFQLPTLFSDWELRNEQDVKDLITLVKDVRPYVIDTLSYTREQADKGLLMTNLDEVKKYCDGILKNGTQSAVLSSMYKNIDAVKLDTKKATAYKKQLKEAFTSSFLPAYEDISKAMATFKKQKQNNEEGLAKFPKGKEYYALLLQQNIGSNKKVEDVKKMAETNYQTHLQSLQKTMMANLNLMKVFASGKYPTTKFKSYEEILAYISKQFTDDFPTVKDLKYHIRDVNEEIASSTGVAAYFNIPAIDGNGIKQLRVNPKSSDITSVPTYATVAHEGFPGHMFQYGYMYENVKSLYQKTLAQSNAYTEGYAVYAQYYAYKYLKDVDSAFLSAYKDNELAAYNAIIAADIGIHYEGWSLQKFTEYLTSKGIVLDDANAKSQYNQLQANPCAFEPYYVGYEEINAMKEKAQKELGDKFEDKAFHTALLKSGAVPFSVVENNVNAYIESNK